MADFATLVLAADSRGLSSGEQALNSLATTAERTESRTGKALSGVGKATEQVAKQSVFATQNSRMMAMQLSQVAQQASATGNVLQAIAIQLPDLALGFGPIGIAAGAAAGAILSYFASYSSGDSANDILRDQEDLIRRVAERWGEAYPAIQRYNEEIERTREQSELLAAIDIIKADQLKDVGATVEQLRIDLADFESMMQAGGEEPEVIIAFRDALEAAIDKLEEGQDATADLGRATDILSNDIENTANPAIATMIQMLAQLAAASQQTAQAVASVVNSAASIQGQLQNTIQGATFRDTDGAIRTPGAFTPFNPATPDSRPLIELDGLPGSSSRRRGGGRGGKSQAQLYDDIVEAANRRIASLDAERAAVGLTEEEADRLLYTTELLNEAQQRGIKLSDPQRVQLESLADAMARVAEETRQASDNLDFQRDMLHGIFGDIRSALDDGKLDWEDLGDVAIGVLDRIIDKLQGDLVDSLMNLKTSSGGGRGLFDWLPGLFGGGNTFKPTTTLGNYLMGIPGFEGGGYTGSGSRSGGLDGKGGYIALVHPQETIIDHAKGGRSANDNRGGPNYNIDARTTIQASGNAVTDAELRRWAEKRDAEMPSRVRAIIADINLREG